MNGTEDAGENARTGTDASREDKSTEGVIVGKERGDR
jgi:hypothetical protein